MIRKDQLPDVWPDGWHSDAPASNLHLHSGDDTTLILCHENDAPMFMLAPHHGYTLLPDRERMHIEIDEGASLKLYRLQGPHTPSLHLTDLSVTMQANASLHLGTVTLGGGHVRNNIVVRMQGEGCTCTAGGLYLIDREQQCDNYIFVEHAAPRCTSNELYKGIMDDAARARFNGHVLVQDGACKTEAHQTNRNILLTDKAHIDTRPFLEIYNDDVVCSHGSTIGQLDEQAMFYLMTRGIPERVAVTMLSYAFCDEVIAMIDLPQLREAVADVVKKRLHGELSPACDDCAIPCSTPCNGSEARFEIDPSKL